MINLKKASTKTEMIITLCIVGLLVSAWLFSININKKFQQFELIADEQAINNLKIAITAYEQFEEKTLFPKNFKPGFYTICKQDAINCKTDDKNININDLLKNRYLTKIPNHSIYSDSNSSGYVLHFNSNGDFVILTKGYLENINANKVQ